MARIAARTASRLFGSPVTDDDVYPGEVIGRYRVIEEIGRGGMGVLYSAHDTNLGRTVALKFVRTRRLERVDEEHLRARLEHEGEALARFNHPNVVTIHDRGYFRGRVWLAMEYVEGRTLRGWLSERPRRWSEILRVMREVGCGVAAVHAAGFVHRDLKPENIMIRPDERVLLLDFGLVQRANSGPSYLDGLNALTSPGEHVGTPGYMAPEQSSGSWTDDRADQFSYCLIFWEALYGERLPSKKRQLLFVSHSPTWLRKVLRRGLSADPAQRWASMNALLAALDHGVRRRHTGSILENFLGFLGGISLVIIVAVHSRNDPQRLQMIAGAFILGPVLLYAILVRSEKTSFAALLGGIFVFSRQHGTQPGASARVTKLFKPASCVTLVCGAIYSVGTVKYGSSEDKPQLTPSPASSRYAVESVESPSGTRPPDLIRTPIPPERKQERPPTNSRPKRVPVRSVDKIVRDAQRVRSAEGDKAAAHYWDELVRLHPGVPEAQIYRQLLAEYYLEYEKSTSKALRMCEEYERFRGTSRDRDAEIERVKEMALKKLASEVSHAAR